MASKTDNLYAIARGKVNGKILYVAVGDNGTILTAEESGPGPGAWTLAMSNTAENLRGIVFTEGKDNKFYAVGDNGTLVTSTDGTAWTASTLTNPGETTHLRSVAYNKQWLYITSMDDIDAIADESNFISQDGVTWTAFSDTDQQYQGYLPGFAVVANNSMSGRFVKTINTTDRGGMPKMMVFQTNDPTGDFDVAGFGSGVGLSSDEFLYGLATDETGRYVAVGDNFKILMATDDNLLNWKDVNQSAMVRPRTLRAVAMSGEHFVAVGDFGAVIKSADGGESWDLTDAGTLNKLRGVVSTDLIGKNNTKVFIVVGDKGEIKAIEA